MDNKYLIKCGKLFDGIELVVKQDVDILINNGVIIDVTKNIDIMEGVVVIDLKDELVTPGLIDAHIHPEFFEWKTLYSDYHKYSDEWITLATLHTAQKTLERGFTTIRVMGSLSRGYGLVDVRNAINSGYFKGSRLKVAPHSYSSTGGHGDLSNLVNTNLNVSNILKTQSVGSGADFFTEATRKDMKHGADFVKIIVSGGFSTPNDTPYEQQLSDEELLAIINTANSKNIPVTAHAYTPSIIKKLISLGVSGIEHGSLIDRETAELMKKQNVYLIPTFSPFDEIIFNNDIDLGNKPKHFSDKLKKYKEELIKGREIIINSGMKLGFGSDHVAVYNNYESWREFESWVNNGIDPLLTLKAATSVNAEILGDNSIGSIKIGKKADIVAWDKELLNNSKLLSKCLWIMKEGEICKF